MIFVLSWQRQREILLNFATCFVSVGVVLVLQFLVFSATFFSLDDPERNQSYDRKEMVWMVAAPIKRSVPHSFRGAEDSNHGIM